MTRRRGDAPRRALVSLVLAVAAVVLAGCSSLPTAAPAGTAPSVSPSPTPTAACPIIEGVELPPDCAPYDPDHAMAQNERHHQRMDLSDESRAAAAGIVEDVRVALEALRASGTPSADAVATALEQAGLDSPQVNGGALSVEFGGALPAGGCVFGQVSADAVSVDVGGYVMDGGCLAIDGH